jgi:hypothetical protein
MNNKLLSPLAALALVFVGLAFAAVAFLVFVTRGKSEFWTDKKMLLGGVLLSLTSFLGSGCSGCGQVTCYAPANPDPEILCYDVPNPDAESDTTDTLQSDTLKPGEKK